MLWASALGRGNRDERRHIIATSLGREQGRRPFHGKGGANGGQANGDAGEIPVGDRLEITLGDGGDQDQEWCEVAINGERRRIRFHDYHEIYEVPGLYERLFYDELECDSPRTLRNLLEGCLERQRTPEDELRVFDLGAGNGMMGEQLKDLGAEEIVGADLLAEAAAAAERDRPGVYDDYVVGDLTEVDDAVAEDLAGRRFNCLTTVAALGFGDIPPPVFTQACELIEPDGWVVFNIKEDFLGSDDQTGFSRLIRESVDDGALELEAQRRYRHRLSTDGEPLYYAGLVARKRGALPEVAND
jgi:2-polyprenyl-3-methyl-5-hydroxy-6-metoxy-1,4-benzoquinol methylase